MDLDMGTSSVSFDSTKGEADGKSPLADFYKKLIGTEFTVRLPAGSRPLRIEGGKELIRELEKAGDPAVKLLGATLRLFELPYTAEWMFLVGPNHLLKPGDAWTEKSKWSLGLWLGSWEATHRYTYMGTEGVLDKIKVTATYTITRRRRTARRFRFRSRRAI